MPCVLDGLMIEPEVSVPIASIASAAAPARAGARRRAARVLVGVDRVDHLAGEVAEAGRLAAEAVRELGQAELAEDDDAVRAQLLDDAGVGRRERVRAASSCRPRCTSASRRSGPSAGSAGRRRARAACSAARRASDAAASCSAFGLTGVTAFNPGPRLFSASMRCMYASTSSTEVSWPFAIICSACGPVSVSRSSGAASAPVAISAPAASSSAMPSSRLSGVRPARVAVLRASPFGSFRAVVRIISPSCRLEAGHVPGARGRSRCRDRRCSIPRNADGGGERPRRKRDAPGAPAHRVCFSR